MRQVERDQYWYAMATRRGAGKFHKARPDWLTSGRAICGANIRQPGWVRDLVSDAIACKACRKREREQV